MKTQGPVLPQSEACSPVPVDQVMERASWERNRMSTMVPGTGPVLTCPTLSRRDCFPPVVATPIAAARLLVQYPTVCEKCCYVFLSELRRLFLRWRWGYLPVRTSREKSEVWLWWVHVRHHAGLPQLTSSHSVDRQHTGTMCGTHL